MKILIVTAHPNPHGFTHKIAETYKKTSEQNGAKVEILNLYTTDLQQGFLVLNETNRYPEHDKVRDQIQAKITRADQLVFVCPMRWGDCPAILKNFLDVNLTSGFAYRFMEGKLLPQKLLAGKTSRMFVTSNGPRWFYNIVLQPMRTIRWLFRLNYFGMKMLSFDTFFSIGYRRSEEERNEMLQKVMRRALKNK